VFHYSGSSYFIRVVTFIPRLTGSLDTTTRRQTWGDGLHIWRAAKSKLYQLELYGLMGLHPQFFALYWNSCGE